MIRLKGQLDLDLTKLGLRAGDEIKFNTPPASNGAIYFEVRYNGTTQNCVVWSDNYELIESDHEETK